MDAYRTVDRVVLTEKGTRLAEANNTYQFKVDVRATKADVRRAVEQLFGVTVTKVNTLNRRGKKKRERTRHFGTTARWKKALVTLKPGDAIDLT